MPDAMMRPHMASAVVLVLVLLVSGAAMAHSPTTFGDNERLAGAATVPEPTKSWAAYSEIHEGGEARYFKLELKAGERLYAGVFLNSDTGFLPRIAAMGPGWGNDSALPASIEVPAGYGQVVVKGALDGREYEPFTPASYYQIAKVDITVNRTATYYIAVFEPDHGGKFGLAIGYVESFTAAEWLLIPINVINIHLWEGQPLMFILAPVVVAFGVGLPALAWRAQRKEEWPFPARFWPGAAAGLLLIGTGMMTVLQMALAMAVSENPAGGLVTALFAAIPIALGFVALREAQSDGHGAWPRAKMILVGVLGLVFWGGLFVGPALAFVHAAWPAGRRPGAVSREP
jgi:hypothetical protein